MVMRLRNTLRHIWTIALVALLVTPAIAVCTKVTTPDEDMLLASHACSPSFVSWFRKAFNLHKGDWDEGWGWAECNAEFAFPKMLNSGYLLVYGLDNSLPGRWHDNVDYYTWASGLRHDFRYDPVTENDDEFASAVDGWFKTNRVKMKCLSFAGNWNAGFRAGTMLHEATHLIYYRYEHKTSNPGSNCPGKCSDDWFFHTVGEYPYGKLSDHKHSMVQLEAEFDCDLSQFAFSTVPVAITMGAGGYANELMDNQILNPPGWRCGLPRPLPAPFKPPLCPNNQRCCDPTPHPSGCTECVPLGASCQ